MNRVAILFVGILMISCTNKNQSNSQAIEAQKSTANFDWLIGNWERTNNEEGKKTYETWRKNKKSNYQGLGFTLQGKDTVSQEKMKIIQSENSWRLEVIATGETENTIFKITKIEEDKFVAENKEIEFPNKVEYEKVGEIIKANVSSPEMEIPFEFVRIEELPR